MGDCTLGGLTGDCTLTWLTGLTGLTVLTEVFEVICVNAAVSSTATALGGVVVRSIAAGLGVALVDMSRFATWTAGLLSNEVSPPTPLPADATPAPRPTMPNAPVTTHIDFLFMVLPFVGDLRRSVSH